MNRKTLIFAGTVAVLASFLYVKQHVFGADTDDLFFHSKSVNADEVNEPEPGKAYAFHKRKRAWERTAACVLLGVQRAEPRVEVFYGRNKAGKSYNEALGSLSGNATGGVIGLVMAQNTEREWSLNKHFNQFAGGQFNPDCIRALEARVRNPVYDVYVVDTVYFAGATMKDPFMVSFKPEPFVLEVCDTDCMDARADLSELLRPAFFTRLKRSWFELDRSLGNI